MVADSKYGLFFCIFLGIRLPSDVESGKVKVVDAPFSFNNPLGSNGNFQEQEKKLLLRVDPEEPSGPPYLIEKLNGKCFEHIVNNYKYTLCPYNNVTQREQTYRYNSYHGVLGVWKHWSFENGSFIGMEMMHGDVCLQTLERQISIILKCGEKNKIITVTEPETCKYKMIFKTPYACPIDVFQVYPILSDSGKVSWQELEDDYALGMYTKLGYQKRQKKILVKEGLHVEEENKLKRKRQEKSESDSHFDNNHKREPNEKTTRDVTNEFISRHQCVQAYEKLHSEVITLREKVRKLENKTVSNAHIENNVVVNLNTVGKYKRGELGAKVKETATDNGRIARKVAGEDKRATVNGPEINPKRGEAGLLDESQFPSRHLQDRIHED